MLYDFVTALSNILENTAFVGDILMRLPEITGNLLKNRSDWKILLEWSLKFVNQTQLLDSETRTLIDIVSQLRVSFNCVCIYV